MASAQVGKTEGLINNTIGYHIDQDPAPILIVLETESKAEAWSKERLTPMLKDTPCLAGKVRDSRARDSDNKILFKEYPGGLTAKIGINLPAVLGIQAAEQPPRYVAISKVRQMMKTAQIDEHEVSSVDSSGGARITRMYQPEVAERATMITGDANETSDKLIVIFQELGVL